MKSANNRAENNESANRLSVRHLTTIFFLLSCTALVGQVKIVVLGSSTAAGTGASHPDSAWVNRYWNFLQDENPENEVINLAKGGYTTYHLLPTGIDTPGDRPDPDITRNINAALDSNPDAIIINLPSNDAANGFAVEEQLANYEQILQKANEANVPVWISTPQGRNLNLEGRTNLIEMRDSTYARYGDMAIDFWTNIAQSDGQLNTIFSSGDGIHLNDRGHRLLFERVVEKDIPGKIISGVIIVDDELHELKLYPNPANEVIYISRHENVSGPMDLRVVDMSGREGKISYVERTDRMIQVDIRDLEVGFYQLILSEGQVMRSQSFVKQ